MCCIYREDTVFSGIARFMNLSKRWVDRRVLADCSRFDSRPYHYFLSVELTSKNVHVVCKNVIVSSASLCCSVGVQYGTKGIFDVINIYFTMM